MIECENFYSFVVPQKVDTDIIKDAGSEYYFYKQRASRLCRHQELYRSLSVHHYAPPVIGSPLLGFIRDLYSYSVRSCWCTQKEGTFTGTFLKTL